MTSEQVNFRDLLLRLHKAESTVDDWKLLNLSAIKHPKLEHPIAHINARHSSVFSEDMSGLEPVVFLAKGAKVMLTMNLWSSVGLCNAATGTSVDFIFKNSHQSPAFPIAVIVQFENYTGPSLIDTQPSRVPICPITVSSQTENGFHERQQLPLRLAGALTIHKSHGRSW